MFVKPRHAAWFQKMGRGLTDYEPHRFDKPTKCVLWNIPAHIIRHTRDSDSQERKSDFSVISGKHFCSCNKSCYNNNDGPVSKQIYHHLKRQQENNPHLHGYMGMISHHHRNTKKLSYYQCSKHLAPYTDFPFL